MNWIRTDINIGYRIRCFEFDFRSLEEKWSYSNKQFFEPTSLENLFLFLRSQKHFPQTSSLVRISMPPNKMCISFWVQDSSFPPIEMGTMVEAEYIELKKDKI